MAALLRLRENVPWILPQIKFLIHNSLQVSGTDCMYSQDQAIHSGSLFKTAFFPLYLSYLHRDASSEPSVLNLPLGAAARVQLGFTDV